MRSITTLAACALLALPLVSVSPAHADDFMDKAQKFFNNDNDRDRDRDAYERGRRDQMQQAERDRWQRERERDWYREHRPRDDYSYSR